MKPFAIMFLITAMAGCASEFPEATGRVPSGKYRRADLWREVRGYDLNRMELESEYNSLYRTQWITETGSTYLVCLQPNPGQMFGTPYNVYVFDRELKLIRSGKLTAQQDYWPLAIVEVKPDGKELPANRRGSWQLAIVLTGRQEPWDPALPLRLVGFDDPDEEANYEMCELIAWGDDELTARSGNLSEIDSIEFRTAEKNWQVSADGTVNVLPNQFPTTARPSLVPYSYEEYLVP